MKREGEYRWPHIGDLLISICRRTGDKCIGVIYEFRGVSKDKVMVKWSTNPPSDYHGEYGLSATNIHNLRREHTLVRGHAQKLKVTKNEK